MTAYKQHVDYQLLNEHTRVGYLFDSIKNSDTIFQVEMSSIQNNKSATGMRNNYEAAVAHLLLMDPVANRREEGTKQGTVKILDTAAEVYSFIPKHEIGKTGSCLRYHTYDKYEKLNKDQQEELQE